MKQKSLSLTLSTILLLSLLSTPLAYAQKHDTANDKAAIEADSLSYDKSTDIVTASGNVKIFYQGKTLTAEEINWNQTTDIIQARKNVIITDSNGMVTHTDEAEISDQMREAVTKRLRVLMPDKSRMTGASAIRKNKTLLIVNKANYTICKPCKENPKAKPSWQIKTGRTIHDELEQKIIHEDMRLELGGVPVLYLPYLSQPTSDVKKRSGFLTPSFSSSSDLGTKISLPYFVNLAPNYDLTVNPSFYSKAGNVLGLNFRHRVEKGTYNIDANGLWVSKEDNRDNDETFRGNIKAEGHFLLKEDWHYGFQIEQSSDETFLRRYKLSSQNYLESYIYATHLKDKTYFDTRIIEYDTTLASVNDDNLPNLMPHLKYEKVLDKKLFNGFISVEGDLVRLKRQEGLDVTRLIGKTKWERRFQAANGQIIDLFSSLRGDVYNVSDIPSTNTVFEDGFQTRAIGYIGAKWSYPLINYSASSHQIIEPAVQLIASPNVKNNTRYPNEDSLSFDFDSSNLFEESRSSGYDIYESGSRIDYGIKYSVQNNKGQYATIFVGQSQRQRKRELLNRGSGLENEQSDYVLDFRAQLTPDLKFSNRLRLARKSFEVLRSEADIFATLGKGSLSLGYVLLDKRISSDNREREELRLNASYKLYGNWYADTYIRQDMYRSTKLNSSVGIAYRDECTNIRFSFVQDYVRDRNIGPSNSFNLTINLKTLGGIGIGSKMFENN